MAKSTAEFISGQTQHDQKPDILQAGVDGHVELPSSDLIANAAMTRDGDDLILQGPGGESVMVEGYFSADPAPLLTAPDGYVLTPALVHSFVKAPMEFAANETANDESPVGAVEEVSGNATVTRADGTIETIAIGTPIYEGDIIQTDANGAVNITFIDQTSMAISQNARMAIDEYTFNPETENGTTNFSVLRGLFVFTSGLIGRDDPDDVKIETPVGSIGIRGTIIAGEIAPGGESKISVLEGAIVITNGLESVTLSEQFETVRLGGFDAPMHNMGVLPANDIGTRFNSIGNVLPSLFTTIDDSASEQGKSPSNQAPVDAQPKQETPAPSSEKHIQDNIIVTDLNTSGLPSHQTAAGLPPSTNPSDLSGGNIFSTITPSSGGNITPTLPIPVASESTSTTISPIATAPTQSVTPQLLPVTPTDTGPVTNPAIVTSFNLDNPVAHVGVISDTISNAAGYSISALGDLNHDGFADFIFTNDSATQNQVYIAHGGLAEFGTNTIPGLVSAGKLTVKANPAGTDFFGTEVSGIGDFDGDGVGDYIIGQSNKDVGYNNSGTSYVIDGSSSNNYAFNGIAAEEQLGRSVSGLGDFNNDGYTDLVIGTNNDEALYIGGTNTTPSPQRIMGTSGTGFGESVRGLGDFNGDGYSDFAIGAPITNTDGGNIDVYLGNKNASHSSVINTTGSASEQLGLEIGALGDINGDGLSDLISYGGGNSAKIFMGGSNLGSSIDIEISGGYEIIGGGGIGDFNGDGYDDFTVSVANSTTSTTYVVLGQDSLPSMIDMSYLTNGSNAFSFKYSGMNISSEPDIQGVGDVNGDGYDDFAMSVPDMNGGAAGDGGMFLIYGRTSGNVANSNTASADGQHLMATGSTPNLFDGSHENVSMRGTAAANVFEIHNTNFLGIHGGGNGANAVDTIKAVGNLDFSDVNFESISGIERLAFSGNSQTITLSLENIFNLLKSSSGYSDGSNLYNGFLKIDGAGMTGANLVIDADTASGAGTDANIVSALNEMGSGAAAESASGGYRHFSIGGYDLFIDNNVSVNVA